MPSDIRIYGLFNILPIIKESGQHKELKISIVKGIFDFFLFRLAELEQLIKRKKQQLYKKLLFAIIYFMCFFLFLYCLVRVF